MAPNFRKPKCGCNVPSLLTGTTRLCIAKKRLLTSPPLIDQFLGIITLHLVHLFWSRTSRFLICRLRSVRSVPLPSARGWQSSPTLNSGGQMRPKSEADFWTFALAKKVDMAITRRICLTQRLKLSSSRLAIHACDSRFCMCLTEMNFHGLATGKNPTVAFMCLGTAANSVEGLSLVPLLFPSLDGRRLQRESCAMKPPTHGCRQRASRRGDT